MEEKKHKREYKREEEGELGWDVGINLPVINVASHLTHRDVTQTSGQSFGSLVQ